MGDVGHRVFREWPASFLATRVDAVFSHRMRVTEGGGPVGSNGSVPGTASLHLVNGATLLRPEEQVFAGMLSGFANQQLARNLARTTAEGRENTVRAFAAYVNTYPWLWTPANGG